MKRRAEAAFSKAGATKKREQAPKPKAGRQSEGVAYYRYS